MITSRRNEKLRLVRKLLRSRKHREETGLFAVEGEDLVDAALGEGIEPVELLVAGETVRAELLAEVSTLGHAPRVIAVFRASDLPRGSCDVVVGLWRLSDPGNVGAILRTADAFGAAVALSEGCADPLGPRAARASAGAVFRIPLLGWEALPERQVALVAHGGAALRDVEFEPPLGLLLGSERSGLPDELVARSEAATIELPGKAESLNVAAAAAIALYELERRRGTSLFSPS
ncbi:MAG: rRNA methyltransferase [Gaiellaceae bacterium]|nr:MAG: rRNA methyltransferase [Gaiellaceae bacterium]